ncbi:hypothetical protein BBJ28_00004884 [Nothophytophthora sp. Chile5]|nr:hypothetical protein BBJ28_00004884 [Nothophytophthora sp. Chile5]
METLSALTAGTDVVASCDDLEGGKEVTIAATCTIESTEMSVKDAYDSLVHDRKILHSVTRIIFSAIYFVFFTAMLFAHIPTARMYEQAYAVSSSLATAGDETVTPSSPIKFFNIGQLGDVFDWFSNTLVPAVFVTQDQNGVDLPTEEWARVALFNKALGGVLIEVSRKSPVDCEADGSLYKLYPTCYDYQDLDSEYGAYLLPFTLNASDALKNLADWKTEKWIDVSTSEVMVSILTYNGELEGYVVAELVLEFHAGGFITPKSLTRPTISIPYGETSIYVKDALVAFWWVLAVLWSTAKVFWWRKKEESPSPYNVLKRLSGLVVVEGVVCAFYAVWISIVELLDDVDFQDSLWSLADPEGEDVEGTSDDIKALDTVIDVLKEIAYLTAALRVIGAVVIALMGLQILSRFRFHPQLNILTRTVASALRQFGAFFVVFIVIFLTFTIIGTMIFGDRAKEFSSLPNAMAACINMLFGEFDFDSIKHLQFSVAFYWIYMVVVSLVLMNMMLAIVLDAYEEVSSESYKQSANLAVADRIRTICWDLLCELQISACSRNAVVSRGKVRPLLLERVLKARLNEAALAMLTPQSLRNLFPDATLAEDEVLATLHHIEQGAILSRVLAAEDAEENTEQKESRRSLFKRHSKIGEAVRGADVLEVPAKATDEPTLMA